MTIVGFLAFVVIATVNLSLRVKHVRREYIDGTPQYILTLWHSQLIPLLGRGGWRRPIAAMVSRSKDGEIITRVVGWYGVDAARGSSTRGGSVALRELLREARAGKNLVFTPDGPRGPARVAKDGVVYAAKMTGLPLMPAAFAARRKKFARSWDRMLIPMPFSRCVCVYGEPMPIPRDGDAEEWRMRVEQTLNALSEEAERLVNAQGNAQGNE